MNEFLNVLLALGFITSPITLYIIITIGRELLDFFINRKTINELYERVDNISLEKLENDIEEFTFKYESDSPWTKEHIAVMIKKKELEAKSKKLYNKCYGEKNWVNNYFEIHELDRSLKEYEKAYWISKFGIQKSEYELSEETRLRKVFTPE